MSEVPQMVVFVLDGQRYALPLHAVERVIRAAEVTLLPKAPAVVCGVIDVGGRVLPVLNMRLKFRLPEHEIGPGDQFLIARTARRAVALVIDEVLAVIEYPQSGIVPATQIVPGLDQVEGVVQLEDGLVLVHDLEKFLSLDEEEALEEAMPQEVS